MRSYEGRDTHEAAVRTWRGETSAPVQASVGCAAAAAVPLGPPDKNPRSAASDPGRGAEGPGGGALARPVRGSRSEYANSAPTAE